MRHARWWIWVFIGLLAQVAGAQGKSTDPKPLGIQKPATKTALPARKPGLWEVTVRSDDLVLRRQGQARLLPQTVQMCTDSAAEPVMLMAIVPGQENCRQVTSRRMGAKAGGGWQIQTVCYVHDNRVDSDMRIMGNLQAQYHGFFHARFPSTPIHNTGRMLFEGRRLGACKAQQRPGDMVLPNGVTVNVVDDRKEAESEGH